MSAFVAKHVLAGCQIGLAKQKNAEETIKETFENVAEMADSHPSTVASGSTATVC